MNIASNSGLQGIPYAAADCASKGGVVLLTKSLAVEYSGTGVRVNAERRAGWSLPCSSPSPCLLRLTPPGCRGASGSRTPAPTRSRRGRLRRLRGRAVHGGQRRLDRRGHHHLSAADGPSPGLMPTAVGGPGSPGPGPTTRLRPGDGANPRSGRRRHARHPRRPRSPGGSTSGSKPEPPRPPCPGGQTGSSAPTSKRTGQRSSQIRSIRARGPQGGQLGERGLAGVKEDGGIDVPSHTGRQHGQSATRAVTPDGHRPHALVPAEVGDGGQHVLRTPAEIERADVALDVGEVGQVHQGLGVLSPAAVVVVGDSGYVALLRQPDPDAADEGVHPLGLGGQHDPSPGVLPPGRHTVVSTSSPSTTRTSDSNPDGGGGGGSGAFMARVCLGHEDLALPGHPRKYVFQQAGTAAVARRTPNRERGYQRDDHDSCHRRRCPRHRATRRLGLPSRNGMSTPDRRWCGTTTAATSGRWAASRLGPSA